VRSWTQLVGIALAAIGVAVTLRGVYHWGGTGMIALGLCLAVAGNVLIFRGHYRRR
jgi:hypothetical protein